MTPPTAGRVFLQGKVIGPRSPRQMLRLGLAYLPEDRDAQGLIMPLTIVENVTLPIVGRLARFGVVCRTRERRISTEAVDASQVRATGVDQAVSSLSGGNRQKVAFAEWLTTGPVAADPRRTRSRRRCRQQGADYKIIAELADAGLTVLLISSDLPEILAMSDRMLVIAEGRLAASFTRSDATQERIMTAATSSRRDAHAAV